MEALEWLGLRRVDADGGDGDRNRDGAGEGTRWRMEVGAGVLAGSGALYGGCATAAGLVLAAALCDHSARWATTHFTGAAPRGTTIFLHAKVLSAWRTVTHAVVDARAGDRGLCFTTRAMLGDRKALVDDPEAVRPAVPAPGECAQFHIDAHPGTFAERFDWRLADAGGRGSAAWWVRPHDGPLDAALVAAVVTDYVTYGIGRAAGHDVGGMSVDNTVRLHDARPVDGWVLLVVTPDAFDGGFASGTARVWREDGALICTGSQTMVLNRWNWRQEGE